MPTAHTPAEVQVMLGVSDATLRRMARAYEKVYGELPTDIRQARVYPDEAIKRIEAARAAVDQGKAASFEKALALLAGSAVSPEALLAQTATPEPVKQLLSELQAIRHTLNRLTALLEEQGERLEALEAENRQLREQLALPKPQEKRRWWKWPWWL